MNKAKPHKIVERFFKKVDKQPDDWLGEGCWLWTGARDLRGYGQFGDLTGKTHRAHRLVAMAWFGNLPRTTVVRHICDMPSCVNPAHLRLGTHQENMQDAKDRGRMRNSGTKVLSQEAIADMKNEDLTYREAMLKHGVCERTVANYRMQRR